MCKEPQEDKTNKEKLENDGLQQFLAYFEKFYSIEDPIHREYELIQAAKKCDIPPDSFRQMFKNYYQQRLGKECSVWRKPLWQIERGMEWLAFSLSEMDFFKILEYLAKLSALSILAGVIGFFIGIQNQAEQSQKELDSQLKQQKIQTEQKEIEKKRTQYEAWQVITSARSSKASVGRIEALEFLNSDKVVLSGLEAEGAFLSGIQLQGASLQEAKLQGARLFKANLQGANLFRANLSCTKPDFIPSCVDLKEANLEGANLQEADLSGSDLRANLTKANLQKANLQKANLQDADLREANLQGTDLRGVKNLNLAQVKLAKNW